MFWCHPCGLAFCLECRTCGLACDHNIVNYSSELSNEFLPDSIGSSNSPFDIGCNFLGQGENDFVTDWTMRRSFTSSLLRPLNLQTARYALIS